MSGQVRDIAPAGGKSETITAIYQAVEAPSWARPNLDALADVLRDLSWLPEGPLELRWSISPDLAEADRVAIASVLAQSSQQSADSPRPFTVHTQHSR
ncbi:Barstar (barnase inhibitor) [Frankineae bacterium MT45]|nr:Barstar (barnase inhibitor) [Frankineae bacterium MT45]